jgi:D-glycero-alpha-D-manno-heptose-7-phosphate kinase
MQNVIARARSPLRLGLAGGGTDVSPYSDRFGGCILNATISLFAHCTLEINWTGSTVFFHAIDMDEIFEAGLASNYPLDGHLTLHKGVYNRVIRDFNGGKPLSVKVKTWADAPSGSGLGTSSTMVVTILAAFRDLLSLPLGEYDLAHLAFEIERIDCGLLGGKQDQYAATFGGFNFMEFYDEDKVIVNPLRIRSEISNELESSILLFFTGRSRESARIISDQILSAQAPSGNDGAGIGAMHSIKQQAVLMKEKLLRGDINQVHEIILEGWRAKKLTGTTVSNAQIDSFAQLAMDSGAKAVKISGAGGGGFMMIFVDPTDRLKLMKVFSGLSGQFYNFNFTQQGTESWRIV